MSTQLPEVTEPETRMMGTGNAAFFCAEIAGMACRLLPEPPGAPQSPPEYPFPTPLSNVGSCCLQLRIHKVEVGGGMGGAWAPEPPLIDVL